MARTHAGQEAADAGDRGAGQQAGEDGLGADGARRVIQGSGRGGLGRRQPEAVQEVGRSTRGMAQRWAGPGKPGNMSKRLERA